MSLFQRIVHTFNPPSVLTMEVIEGGIRATFQQRGQIIEWQLIQQARTLPKEVYQTFKQGRKLSDRALLLSFSQARLIASVLSTATLSWLQLNVQAVMQLQVVTQPLDFAIHWALDTHTWSLRRTLHGADMSLGNGWFKWGTLVWQIKIDANPVDARELLDKPTLSTLEIIPFLTHIMPEAVRQGLSLTADVAIAPEGALRLEIVNMLDRSLDLRLKANPAVLLDTIRQMPDNPQHWISGNQIFLNFGAIRGQLLENLKTGKPDRVTGDDLPVLIQDVLRPHGTALGINVDALNTQYPMIPFEQLIPHWRLERRRIRGVGSYHATLNFSLRQDSVSRDSLRAKLRNGGRFIRAKQGWIVLSSATAVQLSEFDTRLGEDFVLRADEVLGFSSNRLSTRGLDIPKRDVLTPTVDAGRVMAVLKGLRDEGLPAGLAGFGEGSVSILSAACRMILADYPSARILWVTLVSRQKEIRPMLEKQFRVRAANRAGDYSEPGTVYLSETLSDSLRKNTWAAVIIEDFDKAPSKFEIDPWANLSHDWTLFAVSTSSSRLRQPDGALDLMRLLNMPPTAFDLFYLHCIQAAPADVSDMQPASMIDKLTTAFKQITLRGDAETKSHGVPIPPRPAASERNPIQPDREVLRPQFEVKISHGRVDNPESFISQAKHWQDRTESEAEPVTFMQYWPTYAHMTPDQQHWYFYWRTQGRQGNWLPADLSYLFVYIYELINLIGFETAGAASNALIGFWKHYRRLQPRLDGYLINWIADFNALFNLPLTPLSWLNQVMQEGVSGCDTREMLEAWRLQGGVVTAMPPVLLYSLAGYTPTASKFYQQHNVNGRLDAAFIKSIAALDSHLQTKTGSGLIEFQPMSRSREISRAPLTNALHTYPSTPILIARIDVEPKNLAKLAANLQDAIKFTENVLRTRAGFKGKLRGIELPDGWDAVIERAQVIATPRRKVELDLSQIERLTLESSDVRAMLTVPDEDDAPPLAVVQSLESVQDLSTQPNLVTGFAPIRPADAPDGRLTDLPSVYKIMGSSADSPTYVMIATLRGSGWKATSAVLQAALGAMFLSTVIDQVNERAQELLGDLLLFEEDGLWLLADDFCDEAEYLLDHAYILPVSTQPDYSMLGEGWTGFAQLLQPVHWRILEALLASSDVQVILRQEALAAHTMPNLLIESINGYALDETGDLIIDTMGEPPQLIEETIDSIQQLMAWALNQPGLMR